MNISPEARELVDRIKPLLPPSATVVSVDHQSDGIDIKIRTTQGAAGSLANIEQAVTKSAEEMRGAGKLQSSIHVTAIATY